KLQRAGEDLYLELQMAAPLARLRCLRSPTWPLRPPLRRGAHWRLISHLALNHLSLSNEQEGLLALQEILKLYNFADPEADQAQGGVNQNLIDGLVGLSSRRVVARTGAETSSGFCRGLEVMPDFDEGKC